jgi:hypothetical protein
MSYKETRKTFSKKNCECHTCGNKIKKYAECYVDPKNKKVYCGEKCLPKT